MRKGDAKGKHNKPKKKKKMKRERLKLNGELLDQARAKGVEKERDRDEAQRDEGKERVAPAHVEGVIHVDGAQREEGAGERTEDRHGGGDGGGG